MSQGPKQESNMNFIETADSRETSRKIMEAIRAVAGSETAAVRVWEAPSYEEALAVWERVTNNGNTDSTDFCWGAAGSAWAAAKGIEG
jgi:hypothetical protein